ncbi:LuxR family transcriptional regulator [Arthrobacter sp. MYb211]|uniref:helix-turn-helix transcriptional regulator n=1 Tax=unclassified Arthrobacter TaxID=235627 RepID=UPI000CFB0B5E|nr:MULTISPECIES: LuxR C-terminal-related transcriptional regulator [unclassified Arthrobacter]PRA11897.1 LuxR family transcriptional regulator [Arthrobacter sp. MYb221]PRC08253.1 LuxR family transcriptional regulator [Arthrobacter sp. MYb211]
MSQLVAQDALADLLREVQQQRSALAVLQGPQGSGKSTVIKQLLRRSNMASVTVVTASRWESRHPGAALGPLLERGKPGPSEDLGPALLEYLRADQEQTRVLVIENAQWADAASFEAVRYAWRRLQTERVLIVLVLRDQDIAMLPAETRELLGDTDLKVLHVDVPTAAQAREIVSTRLGIELPSMAAEHLMRYTQGNLHAVLELAQENPEQSWEQWDRWPPAPRALSLHIKQLLDELEPRARGLVEAAAVLGRQARIDLIVRLAKEDSPLAYIQQIVDASLARTQGHSGKVRLGFDSELTQMAVYHQIPLSARIRLHAAAAEIAEDRGVVLGHRADASLLPDIGLSRELEAYAVAQGQRGEWSSAATAFFRAMHLTPEPAQREALLLKAVDAVVAAGEIPRALTFSHQLASLGSSAERDVLSGYIAILQGRAQTANRWLTSAWQSAVRLQLGDTMAVISQRRVLHSLCQLEGAKILEWAEQSLRLAQAGSPQAIESAAIQGLGLAMMGRREEGERVLLELLGKLPTGAQRQRAEMSLGWVYLASGRIELARHELAAASSTDFSEGSLRISLWAKAWLARAEFLVGDWDQALETVRGAQAIQERFGIQVQRPLIQYTAVQIHALRGNTELVEVHLAKSWVRVGSYQVMEVPYRMARAEAARAQANHEEVLLALEPILRLDRSQGIDEPGFWTWQDMYAEALIRSERLEEAEEFIAPLLDAAMKAGHNNGIGAFLGVRGMLLAALGDIDAAREVFEQALLRLQGVGTAYHRARIDFAYGQCLRRAGKRADCVAPLTRALSIFTHLDATVYVERCTRELQASGIGMARREPMDWSTLTAQEQAVAKLVCEGASNRRVAEELFVSTKTVQYHLTKIYAKLAVSTRTELAALTREGFEH